MFVAWASSGASECFLRPCASCILRTLNASVLPIVNALGSAPVLARRCRCLRTYDRLLQGPYRLGQPQHLSTRLLVASAGMLYTVSTTLDLNLDTAITAMSALMIVMLVPSGRYLGLDLTSSYGLGAVSVCQLPLYRLESSLLLPSLSSTRAAILATGFASATSRKSSRNLEHLETVGRWY